MYEVIFNDEMLGENSERFDTFDKAFDYWQTYADTKTCIGGRLIDLDNDEVVWEFGEI